MAGLREITRGLRFPRGPVPIGNGSAIPVEIAAARLTRVLPNGRLIAMDWPRPGLPLHWLNARP
jgi:hypothetical protein